MDWGSAILVVEILLLLAGWLLFQQAKSDLTARAAQIPVLNEVQELKKSIETLIEQIKLESSLASTQLEARCLEARDLISALDRKLNAQQPSDRNARLRDVYALADDGAPLPAIAVKSGFSEGEVELILGLRQRAV